MTPAKYKAIIMGSGGFTPKGEKRGDHPPVLTKEDEAALNTAWKQAASARKTSVKKETAKKARPQQPR